MGSWGHGNLENDAAADWLFEWQEIKTTGFVEGTLDELLENTSSPDPRLCQEALAAAEVVAAWNGHPAPAFDPEALSLVQQVEVEEDELEELKQKSKSAITVISGDSGLMELWEDSLEMDKWRSALKDLVVRLR
jgi:hypothetical protein